MQSKCFRRSATMEPGSLQAWLQQTQPLIRGRLHTHSSNGFGRRSEARNVDAVHCMGQGGGASTSGGNAPVLSWQSHVSRRINMSLAIEEACKAALSASSNAQPDLALVFISSAFASDYKSVVAEIRRYLPSIKMVFGSSGYGVIGVGETGAEEVESVPAVSITLAALPGVQKSLRHVHQADLPDGDASPDLWAKLLGAPAFTQQPLSFIVIADPSFLRIQDLIAGLDYAYPTASKIGGLSSAGIMNQARGLFCWDQEQDPGGHGFHQTGAAVLALHGGVVMDQLVAQGCRPLSSTTWVIEKALVGSNHILAIRDSKGGPELPPLVALGQELRGKAHTEAELRQILQNLTLGLAPDNLKAANELGPQDFLIRAMGIEKSGGMVVGDFVRLGQKVRFMVRDKQGAMEDLRAHGLAWKRRELQAMMMTTEEQAQSKHLPIGMLMFSCNGRGSNLYDEPSFDSKTMTSFIPVPCSGFLCNGEIGMVGSATHLHGFTAAIGVLRAATDTVSHEQHSIQTQGVSTLQAGEPTTSSPPSSSSSSPASVAPSSSTNSPTSPPSSSSSSSSSSLLSSSLSASSSPASSAAAAAAAAPAPAAAAAAPASSSASAVSSSASTLPAISSAAPVPSASAPPLVASTSFNTASVEPAACSSMVGATDKPTSAAEQAAPNPISQSE